MKKTNDKQKKIAYISSDFTTMKFEKLLKENYSLSGCCNPKPGDTISGYYSYDNMIRVHTRDCHNLNNVEADRLILLEWDEILNQDDQFQPENDYSELENIDFQVLSHHENYGIDYSLVVARKLNITKQNAFDIHKKLKDMGLIERVEAKIVQYRKGIVDNKWIKHRNHTYYDLTDKGKNYLIYYKSHS